MGLPLMCQALQVYSFQPSLLKHLLIFLRLMLQMQCFVHWLSRFVLLILIFDLGFWLPISYHLGSFDYEVQQMQDSPLQS